MLTIREQIDRLQAEIATRQAEIARLEQTAARIGRGPLTLTANQATWELLHQCLERDAPTTDEPA
jgi:hypothetical protein